jgi:hypothetical protein
MLPHNSPWQKLYEQVNPTSLLHMTGLTRGAFKMLLNYPFDLKATAPLHGHQHGRPQSLSLDGHLGLLLFYLGRTMPYKHLCLLLMITPSVCSRVITGMLKKVIQKLCNHPLAQVKFPDGARMREFANMVQLRALLVNNIIGFMDGVSFPAECTDKHV